MMKLLQSINTEVRQQQLDEVEFINRGLSKAAGAVPGMKRTAANLGAKADTEQKIKQLKIEFNKWAGEQGKSAKKMSAKDLQLFFKSKGLVAPKELAQIKVPLGQANKTEVNKAFGTAVTGTVKRQARQAAQAGGTPQQGQQPAQQQGQQGDNQSAQTFKSYIAQMDQLLSQMKQAVPA